MGESSVHAGQWEGGVSRSVQAARVRVTLALRDSAAPYTPLHQPTLNLLFHRADVAKNGGESSEESSTRTKP